MEQFHLVGKILIVVGIIIILLGLIILLTGKIPFLGKLPGDINIKGKYFSLYIPIVSCIFLSIILTIILNIFFRK
jgi:hypothetical protein